MKIGEIVETLIRIRNWYKLNETEREALAEACNTLDELPRMTEANAIEVICVKINPDLATSIDIDFVNRDLK